MTSGDRLVVILGDGPFDGIPLVARNLAGPMTEHCTVLFVDPPVSRLTALAQPELRASIRAPRLRRLGPRLYRLTPLVLPGKDRPAIQRLTTRLLRRRMRAAVRMIGLPADIVMAMSAQYDVFGALGERVSVYYAADNFGAGGELLGISRRRLVAGEERLAAAADIIVSCSPSIHDLWAERGVDSFMLPNGVDVDAFADVDTALPAEGVNLDPPVAAVVGHLSERLDLDLLEEVADRMSLLLVGPNRFGVDAERFEDLLSRTNVQWVGAVPFESLPSYYRLVHVGLVPYTTSEFNRSSFPLKALEYLAAGLPVVATDLPALRWLGTDLIAIADTPAEFAALALEEAGRSGTSAVERRSFAAGHTWSMRVRELFDRLDVPTADNGGERDQSRGVGS